jgi:hypothetical protein
MAFVAANADHVRFESRFGDVDGDGRTDVVVRAPGRASDSSPLVFTQAYLAPPPTVQADEMIADHASDLVVMDAPTLDDAVAAAMRVTRRGVDAEEACKLLDGVRWSTALDDFHARSIPEARVIAFDEPSMPTYRARVIPANKLDDADVREAGKRCKDIECSKASPFCAYTDGAYSDYYWFTWVESDGGEALKLVAAGFWSGG